MSDNQINFRISGELKEQFKAKVQIEGTDVTTLLTRWISEYVSGVEVKPTAGIDQLIAIKVEQSLKPIISEMTVIKNKLSFFEEKHQDYEKLRRQVEVMEKEVLGIYSLRDLPQVDQVHTNTNNSALKKLCVPHSTKNAFAALHTLS